MHPPPAVANGLRGSGRGPLGRPGVCMKLAHCCVADGTAPGPSRPLASDRSRVGVGRGKGPSGQPGALRWSGLRCAQTALRCSHPRPRRRTHCVRCAHSVQTAATSQMTIRASRGATGAALLGAPEARSSLPGRAFAGALELIVPGNTSAAARQAVPGGGDFCGGEERRTSVGARSALRELTRRSCLSGESAANAASSATRLKTEHRSGVGAQRRPPQHEPPAGTARRAAQEPRRRGHLGTTAKGRDRPASPPMVEGVVPRKQRGGPTE